jgi:hypothetical protein
MVAAVSAASAAWRGSCRAMRLMTAATLASIWLGLVGAGALLPGPAAEPCSGSDAGLWSLIGLQLCTSGWSLTVTDTRGGVEW